MPIALLCIDLVNDLAHKDGKLAEKGYADFAEQNNTLNRIHRIQDQFRQQGAMVVHTRTCFTENYFELNDNSPFFQKVKKLGALARHSWGTEFLPEVAPFKGKEPIITKHRLSAFHRTRLDVILGSQKVEKLYICGVGTHNAIESTVRDAHDRDFDITVISDACIACSDEEQQSALASMADFATVDEFNKIALELTL
ncbi:MAG: cysteine hydrolase [Alphaproteobacteria bacterium]|nr:cysteine hydrolase [Alphaproteobacteria bacterium]MDD9919215.1 cysteine hydrolase [Alphaproteobacteria bacterium]